MKKDEKKNEKKALAAEFKEFLIVFLQFALVLAYLVYTVKSMAPKRKKK